MHSKTVLLFPVETMSRELDFRLMLAGLYTRKHHRVFLGQAYHLWRIAAQSSRGLFVGKDIVSNGWNPAVNQEYHAIKKRKFKVIHLAEEGAIFPGREATWRMNLDYILDPCVFESEDYVCTWGDFQRDYYRSLKPACFENIRTTGHPRFDLCRSLYRGLFKEEADRYRERYGDFVLINSNFTFMTNPEGIAHTFSKQSGYEIQDRTRRMNYVRWWATSMKSLIAFVELVHRLAIERPDINIVVRPHPSDDMSFFRAVFNGVSTIHVIREGNVLPWILASRVMLHDGCTTAIEAHLLERNIVNYSPAPHEEGDCFLPNLFGARCSTEDEAMHHIFQCLDHREVLFDQARSIPQEAYDLFLNLKQETFPLFMNIMHEAEASLEKHHDDNLSTKQIVLDQWKAQKIEQAKSLVRPLFRTRYASAKHSKARFPGFQKHEIAHRIQQIRAMTKNPIDFTYYSPGLIEITSSKSKE